MGFSIPPTDQYYTVVLESERAEWELSEETGIDPEGMLALRCFRPEDVIDPVTGFYRRTGSWAIHLKAIKGGFQFASADAVYLNMAPEADYQDEIIYSSEAGAEDYQAVIQSQALYLTSQDGMVYASLIFTASPFSSRRGCGISGKLKFTRNGSRRLAVPNSREFGMDWFLKEQP